MIYERPTDLKRALELHAQGGFRLLAGGTDFYPAQVGRPIRESILDLTAISALRGVEAAGVWPAQAAAVRPALAAGQGGWRIGALATWTEVLRAFSASRATVALASAAREVGGVQIQNQATVGGNLCNASPAADGAPALAALDAVVELRSLDGTRWLAVEDFIDGPRRTRLRAGEILAAIWLPASSARAVSAFRKLGHRRYLVISIAAVGLALDFDAGERVCRAGIAVGSCAPKVIRLTALERALQGQLRADVAAVLLDHPASLEPLSPLSDLRGSADYRLAAVRELLNRMSVEVTDHAQFT